MCIMLCLQTVQQTEQGHESLQYRLCTRLRNLMQLWLVLLSVLTDAMRVCFICCGCRPVTLTPTSTLTLPFSGCSSIRFGTPCWGCSLRGKWNICAGQARWLRPPGQSLSGESLLGRTKTSGALYNQERITAFLMFLLYKNILSTGSRFNLASRFSEYTFVDKTHFHCGCVLQIL